MQAICGEFWPCVLRQQSVFWTEDSYSLREMSKNFEKSDLFFRRRILSCAIRSTGRTTMHCLKRMANIPAIRRSILSLMKSSSSVQESQYDVPCALISWRFASGGQQALEQAINRATQGSTGSLRGNVWNAGTDFGDDPSGDRHLAGGVIMVFRFRRICV